MDARIQKHRITRWQEMFLAVFSPGMSHRGRTTKLLGCPSERRSDATNNIPALVNLMHAFVGLFLSGVSAQVSADWDAGTGKCFTSFQTAMEAACALNNPDGTTAPGYVYYRDRCIITSVPNFFVYAHVVTPAGRSLPFTYTRSLPQCDFTISLSGGSEVEPSTDSAVNTLPFIATVIDQSTKQPPTNPVEVHISLKADPTSGGHDHGNSTRPRGGIAEKKICPTDDECWSHATDNGAVVFNFNPTEASGTHTITATCDGCSDTATKSVAVRVMGLEPMATSIFYTKIIPNADTNHPNTNYLTTEAMARLEDIGLQYSVTGLIDFGMVLPPLQINDASLKWGGILDCFLTCSNSKPWEPSHEEHRKGTVVDIRANGGTGSILTSAKMTESFIALTKKIVLSKYPDSTATIAAIHGKGNGRHFHVRLLGRKE